MKKVSNFCVEINWKIQNIYKKLFSSHSPEILLRKIQFNLYNLDIIILFVKNIELGVIFKF